MKKFAFNKLKEKYYKKNVVITTYDDKKIVGKYDSEIANLGIIYIGNEEVLIKDIKEIELLKDNQIYKYVVVVYEDDEYEREYSYKTTLNNIKVGDIVLVDRQGLEVSAEVVDVNLYTRDSAPYPVEKTKDIISIISHSEDDEDDYVDQRTTVNSDDYKYTYDEVEQKVVDKLTKMGLNYKKSLRVILMLRTHYNSDRQCEKMLGFLESFSDNEPRMLEEIEKYARTLADEENWANHSFECPAVNNKYISIIDCLECSDEDIWKEHENDEPHESGPFEVDFEFNDICKNCKWHNPVIEDKAYKNNEPIIFTGLSEEQIKNLNYEDIIAFTLAEGGAMGCPGNVEIVTYINEKLIGYETNPVYGGIPYYKLYKAIPWLEKFSCGIGYVSNVGEGWKHIDTGFGNHLFIRNFMYDSFMEQAKDKRVSEVYTSWKKWVSEIVKTVKYVNEITKTKSRKLNESIFDFVSRNITSSETLPDDFTLESFKNYETGDIIFADGMFDYCIGSELDSDILEQLKNMIKLMDEETIPSNTRLLDNYYKNNKNNTILGTIDEFLSWIRENSKEYNAELIFKFGANAMLCGQQVETVKIGIALLGLFNLTEEDKITEAIKQLALSDEFTLYCDIALSNLKDINNYRFELAKKLHSYGKIILVPKLEVSNKEIEEWLFRYGCENEADNGWLAIDVAEKIDLPKYIKENELLESDIEGLNNIIDGLIEEGPKKGISVYKQKDELFNAIVDKFTKHFEKTIDDVPVNIIYFEILCTIYDYLKEENKESYLIKKIDDLFKNSIVESTIRHNLVAGKILNNVLYVSRHVPEFENYVRGIVYKLFKENLKNGDEKCAISLIHYILEEPDKLHLVLDQLRSDLSYRDNLGDPEPVISFEDMDLVEIIQTLENYPLEGVDFVTQGLMCKSMHPRHASIRTIKKWVESQDKPAKEYLPLDLYAALLELKNKEVIKDYKKEINDIIGIEEDLSKYKEPKVTIKGSSDNSSHETENINLFNGNVDLMFPSVIISRGKEYYNDKMVYNCIKNEDTYTGYVQGSNPSDEYRVTIRVDDNDNIKSMNCTCPYESNCKHEYATIMYIRNKN